MFMILELTTAINPSKKNKDSNPQVSFIITPVMLFVALSFIFMDGKWIIHNIIKNAHP